MPAPASTLAETVDVAVVGAGFGGLGTALRLAECGHQVVVCEALNYPGGCASTFQRKGYSFESGATLVAGLGEGQLLGDWVRRYDMPIDLEPLDPVVEYRSPVANFRVTRDRDAFIDTMCSMPGAPAKGIRGFFRDQERVADVLWRALDDPTLLPPFGVRERERHAGRAAALRHVMRYVGRPALAALERHGLAGFGPMRLWADALCQITVQCPTAEAEAPPALATMDYFWRGAAHVGGGVGNLAWGVSEAVESLGGEVRMSDRVRELRREGSLWRVVTRRGELLARRVVLNLTPHAARDLVGLTPGDRPWLDDLATEVEGGWGAAMLYLVLRPFRAGEGADKPRHLDLVLDPSAPMVAGNHVFVSVGDPDVLSGAVTVTCSTHVPMPAFRALSEEGRAEATARVQERMREALRVHAPDLWARVTQEMTASPRTFERFTRRTAGFVGGVPRRVGLHNYGTFTRPPVAQGVHLVGDSVFPGQSVLATAIAGTKLADRLAKDLRRRDRARPPAAPPRPPTRPRLVGTADGAADGELSASRPAARATS